MSSARTKTASARLSQWKAPGRPENQQKRSSTAGINSGVRLGTNQTAGGSSKSALPKPSARLNAKTINPFDDAAPKSSFETAYVNGAVPCRLQHGSVKHKLQWTTPPENLNFDPILVTFAEGLKETRHPYTFVASEGLKQMMMIEDAEERTIPLLPKLIPPLRQALGSTNIEVFFRTLRALIQLSDVSGQHLNPHLNAVLPQISRKVLDRKHKDKVITALQKLEYNGGREC